MKELEIYLRKLLLSLYLFFRRDEKKKDTLELTKKDKILFVRLNRIGDALVTTHLMESIKKHTGCEIHVLADKKNFFIFENDKNIDKTLIFPKKIKEIKELANQINSSNYTAVFDLHDDVSTTVTFFIGGLKIKNKIGYDKQSRKIFTHLIPYIDPTKHHIIERYLQFLEFLNIPYDKNTIGVNYKISDESKEYAESYIQKVFQNKKYLVGINISAGSRARFWGVENYKNLIQFFENYGVDILLFASPNDLSLAEEICNNKTKISAEPSYDRMAAVLTHLDFLFSPDTSVVHLASGFKLPIFGIYINFDTDYVVWYPYNTIHEMVITEKPTFNELAFETVINKLKIFFEQNYYGKRNS